MFRRCKVLQVADISDFKFGEMKFQSFESQKAFFNKSNNWKPFNLMRKHEN